MGQERLIVIGASLGGVTALRALAAQLPADLAAPVLVVQHIGAYRSMLPELLMRSGPLPAGHATQGERLQPGRVLVAPPDRHMMVEGGLVFLTQGPKEHHARPAVDPLFRSAALSHGPAVIGVVLTGQLDDGTAGLQAIKSAGGTAVVQDPLDAEEPSMPRSAASYVDVDHCVPLQALGSLLARLVREPEPAPEASHEPLTQLAREHRVSVSKEIDMEDLKAIAAPSTFVCPDCHGSLWQIDAAEPPRFRCHTGHAFTLRTLRAAHEGGTEEALWSAIRALQERTLLLRASAASERRAGDAATAKTLENDVRATENQVERLRELVERPD